MGAYKRPQVEQYHLECRVVRVDVRAVLIAVPDGKCERQHWIPLSQVHGDVKEKDTEIFITPWIAKQKGLY